MFDEKIFDGASFGDLNLALEYMIDKIDEIEDELPEGGDDPRLPTFYVIANKILMRMDSIMQEFGHSHPEALARWNEVKVSYEESFEKYADTFLEEDTLLDLE